MKRKISIWTIGHSTHPIEVFINILTSFEIRTLVDVRSFPGSRRHPHFNRERLRESLHAAGIAYVHMPELGGRRRTKPDSVNVAWRNASFRGYADYMETEEFTAGVATLLPLAAERRLVIMCAESLWWRCHRSLISDYLKVKGIEVMHIIAERKAEPHSFTSAAQIVDGELSYRGVLQAGPLPGPML